VRPRVKGLSKIPKKIATVDLRSHVVHVVRVRSNRDWLEVLLYLVWHV
jgi:hypothetical protein